MANGNGKLTKAEREVFEQREARKRAQERAERAPKIGESVKEGIKSFGRAISSGGMAARAGEAGRSDTAAKKRAIKKADE